MKLDPQEILKQLARTVEFGKINVQTPYPPEMKGQEGAAELTLKALESGLNPEAVLQRGLMPGMQAVGDKFSRGEAFIPNMLIAAKAMNAAMEHLRPLFEGGDMTYRGTLILGTVQGDMHDIGKNLVKMVMQGDGWKVLDLGVNVKGETFLQALKEHPDAVVGMSALLTTTMLFMEENIRILRNFRPDVRVFIGGAAVSSEFAESIHADGCFRDPHSFARSFH